jgi:hypothetical protein
MAKLYFYYATMNAGEMAMLLQAAARRGIVPVLSAMSGWQSVADREIGEGPLGSLGCGISATGRGRFPASCRAVTGHFARMRLYVEHCQLEPMEGN